ncbi:hypothetical protein [Burkholderia sp. TSV86]|uniref:hypothetical protein n=1 Tax=Burkholderia sp. TSV86 TaxID=1385594 RepID=UPI0012E3E031|nr:hypothetical protein [Burkholderia sp. TSV86]
MENLNCDNSLLNARIPGPYVSPLISEIETLPFEKISGDGKDDKNNKLKKGRAFKIFTPS